MMGNKMVKEASSNASKSGNKRKHDGKGSMKNKKKPNSSSRISNTPPLLQEEFLAFYDAWNSKKTDEKKKRAKELTSLIAYYTDNGSETDKKKCEVELKKLQQEISPSTKNNNNGIVDDVETDKSGDEAEEDTEDAKLEKEKEDEDSGVDEDDEDYEEARMEETEDNDEEKDDSTGKMSEKKEKEKKFDDNKEDEDMQKGTENETKHSKRIQELLVLVNSDLCKKQKLLYMEELKFLQRKIKTRKSQQKKGAPPRDVADLKGRGAKTQAEAAINELYKWSTMVTDEKKSTEENWPAYVPTIAYMVVDDLKPNKIGQQPAMKKRRRSVPRLVFTAPSESSGKKIIEALNNIKKFEICVAASAEEATALIFGKEDS